MIEQIKDFSIIFFEKLSIEIDNLDVISEWENIFYLKIKTPDSWILIWTHGSVFESLQSLFRNIFRGKFDANIKIYFKINDYVHNKDAKLFSFIDKEINKAKETWRNMKLPVLNWYDRKKVHSYIADLNDSEIITESRWEGKERRLFLLLVKNNKSIPKKIISKLEIDIDGDDI
jgi:predicted RNA-binding protein Jag